MREWGIGFLAALLCLPAAAFAMTSTQYEIGWDSVNAGGSDTSTSASYSLRDTVGEAGTGLSGSSNYQIGAGYRVGDMQEPYLALTINTQETPTRIAWTAFSNGSKTVTVANAGSFSIGNMIGVVENSGSSQLVAFGKITNVNGLILTVDSWSGEPGSLSASPSGGNDYVYRMSGQSAALGVPAAGQVVTSLTVTDVVSNAENGYTVSIQSDGGLRNTQGYSILEIADGQVSAGSEEYGVESVGATALVTATDFALSSTSTRNLQQAATYADHERIGVIYKLSVTASTAAGNYGQTVLYRLTGNF